MIFAEYNYDDDIRVQRQEAMELGMIQGIEQGLQQGTRQKAIEAARNLIRKGVSLGIISECVGLPIDELEKLQKEVYMTV